MLQAELSPDYPEDIFQNCDVCQQETLHVSMPHSLSAMLAILEDNPLTAFYALKCEPCLMS